MRRRLGLITALVLSTGACAPRSASVDGVAVNDLYDFFFVVAAAIFLIVAGLIGWSIFRYGSRRSATDNDALPAQFHTSLPLEIVWFVIPTVIVAVLFILSARVLGDVDDVRDDAAGAPVVVAVSGFRWGWTFDYGNGLEIVSLPEAPAEILLPVDVPITFELTSPDVVHAFYVPRFLVKRDVVPGRTNHLEVTIAEEGVYSGVCAEFCGLLHDTMNFTIRAVPPDEFQRWRAAGGVT